MEHKIYANSMMLRKHIQILNDINSFFVDTTHSRKDGEKHIKHYNECCICLDDLIERRVIYPCGHSQYCPDCVKRIKRCSLCKGDIKDVIKIFL